MQVRQIDHYWIPLPDGTRLAARIWMPEDANDNPMPAVVEYIPYRKGDMSAINDAARYQYVASKGFVCVRVDVRGSGDSQGILTDEYSEQELDDGYHLIEWVARQRWCTGRVGITGISWGGFNALQIAARRPPSLYAVISSCSTDDRYRDDVHYLGGNVLASETLPWATTFQGFQALPPDPSTVGDIWQEMWRERLTITPHFVEAWLNHQQRDAYWLPGSVCEDYGAINCPVLLIGGWADAYTNAIPRLLAGLGDDCSAIIGPWSHGWPDSSRPGPTIDYLDETVRYWQRHLGDDEDTESSPRIRYYQQSYQNPETTYKEREGTWCETGELDPDTSLRLHLTDAGLSVDHSTFSTDIPVNYEHGQDAGVFCPFGGRGQFPADQRQEDQLSVTFDADVCAESISLFGTPMLTFSSNNTGQLALRLCEVATDGTSLLIARGYANIRQPGEHSVALDFIAHKVSAGHRLRLSLGGAYWPFLWPLANQPALNLTNVLLTLPQQRTQPLKTAFGVPVFADGIPYEVLTRPGATSNRDVNDTTGTVTMEARSNRGVVKFNDGLEMSGTSVDRFEITRGNGSSAVVTCERQQRLHRDNWAVSIVTLAKMTADDSNFYVETSRDAFLGDALFDSKRWQYNVKRDGT